MEAAFQNSVAQEIRAVVSFTCVRVKERRRKNGIVKLKKHNGQVTENAHELANLTTDFYKQLYASEGTENMDVVLNTQFQPK